MKHSFEHYKLMICQAMGDVRYWPEHGESAENYLNALADLLIEIKKIIDREIPPEFNKTFFENFEKILA